MDIADVLAAILCIGVRLYKYKAKEQRPKFHCKEIID